MGYTGDAKAPAACCCSTTYLHPGHPDQPRHAHRQERRRGVADLVVEAALSTILDLEDSVAAVDAEDKVLGYSNWLGILQRHTGRVLREAARP